MLITFTQLLGVNREQFFSQKYFVNLVIYGIEIDLKFAEMY